MESRGDTTDEIAISDTSFISRFFRWKRFNNKIPNSSLVCFDGVVMRQFATSSDAAALFPSRYSPSTVLVLPTSIASSICCRSPDVLLYAPDSAREYSVVYAVVSSYAQESTRIQPICHASIAAALVYANLFAAHPARAPSKPL